MELIEENNHEETINLTKTLHKHLAAIYLCASNDLDYLIKDNPSYYRQAEILETELFMLSHFFFVLRVKSPPYSNKQEDLDFFEKIFDNLWSNYVGDCLEIEEDLYWRTSKHLTEAFGTRFDDYEKLSFAKDGLKAVISIAQNFYNILLKEFETLTIFNKSAIKLFGLKDSKMDMKVLSVITRILANVYSVVEFFFNDGINAYITKELKPTKEFLRQEKINYDKLYE